MRVVKKYLLMVFVLLCVFITSCTGEQNTVLPSASDDNETMQMVEQNPIENRIDYKKISFLGAGDNIVYFGTVRDAKSKAVSGGRDYNFKPIYSEVEDLIKNADISFINQETLMCGEGYEFSYYPMFNGPQEMGYDLVDLGFDIVGIANNHMLDKGSDGLEKTIDFLNTLPVTLVGGYKDINDYKNIRVYEKQGIKIAILAYTEHTNGNRTAKGKNVYVPYLDEANIKDEVAKAKEISDLVFVSVHWGEEGAFSPNEYQRKYAKQLADAGVDVILGHHPHVIQPVEWIEGEQGNKTLCAYSLGNFMAEQAYAYNMVGGMISFDVAFIGNSKPVVENVIFIPTVFDWGNGFYNNKIYLLEKYTEEQAKNHGIKSYGRSTSLSQLKGYVSKTISDEFLSDSYKNAEK